MSSDLVKYPLIAILQARMSSTRLPGKVLRRAAGKALLEHEIERIKRAKTLQGIVLATTDRPADDRLALLGRKLNVGVFRGSENDVLDRYYKAAKESGAATVVRLTGDCPFIDPVIIDSVVKFFLRGKYDYVNNSTPPTFPDGMDVEVFSFQTLETAWKKAKLPSEREHVTSYIWSRPKEFRVGILSNKRDLSHIRLTVDEPKDLVLARKIFLALYPQNHLFNMKDILDFLGKNPRIAGINSRIIRNQGYSKSLKKDKSVKR